MTIHSLRAGAAIADLPWRTARDTARGLPRPLGPEEVALATAAGRILAAPVRALAPLPGCDTAAMDGYAVRGPGPWRVVGRRLAGSTASLVLAPGTAVEIATGAPVPAGAAAVVPYEECRRDGEHVMSERRARTHIRRAGEDARPGEELVPAGRRVTSAVLGAAAQAGHDTLTVYRRPAVRLVVTGDEIVHSGVPSPGLVRDAFGPAVSAIVAGSGGTTSAVAFAPDDRATLHAAVTAPGADVVVVTGSSSVGAADHLHRVLADLGAAWHVDGVLCRPGHPQLLASLPGGAWVVGLPGNPFAGLVAAVTLLQPLLEALTGTTAAPTVRLPVTGACKVPEHGVRIVPVRLETTHAEIVTAARPASLRAAATADALAVIEPGWTGGAPADLLLLHESGPGPAVPTT
ncbi:molybdopterin molybdotransferase MoeA [Dactylosporangium sp. CA-233914]|uniref:molybdopterin molybdotransferase MoeA n=1 Tax=Dactylosporangium sp. CA-233914 TaxID=3239934 RepID=UPI003D935B2F